MPPAAPCFDTRAIIKKKLFAEGLVPICHPDLVASGAIRKPADIKALHLLHKRGPINNWKHWGDHHDLGDINPLAGAHYDFFSMVIEAAIPGLGIGLVPR